MVIRELRSDDLIPIDLLLTADPSREHVEEYVQRGVCFIAEVDDQYVGVYVLLLTRTANH